MGSETLVAGWKVFVYCEGGCWLDDLRDLLGFT